jgi:hypothetical protein
VDVSHGIPVKLVQAMLRRELLLLEVKLHSLEWGVASNKRKMRQLRTQLSQVDLLAELQIYKPLPLSSPY